MGAHSYSDLVCGTSDILSLMLGLQLSTRVIADNVSTNAQNLEAYYAQQPVPAP
jgi:hypothetical protein